MTAVYSPYQPPPQRYVHFGSTARVTTPSPPYAAGQTYRQPIATPPAPPERYEKRQLPDRPTTSRPTPRPAPASYHRHAASAPLVGRGNVDYFGIATSERPRQAESAPARESSRIRGPKSYNLDSLLNDFLSLPPLTVTIEAIFHYNSISSCWELSQDAPIEYVKTLAYEPRQYVDGIVSPQCISAAFMQQKVPIKLNQFGHAEKHDNSLMKSALHMYGGKQSEKWGKRIRVRAEIDYPRKMAWFGARPRENGKKVFTVLSATTVFDLFPNIPGLPSNFKGNRQNSYVKK